MNKIMTLSETKKVNTELKHFSEKVNTIAFNFAAAKRLNSKTELKSSDEKIALNFINSLINALKSSDITLNVLSAWTLDNNKISGLNKIDLKKSETGIIIEELLTTGKITNKETGKPLFAKGIKYYHIGKKIWYEFKNLEQWKLIDNDFKNFSREVIAFQGFQITLSSGEVEKISFKIV